MEKLPPLLRLPTPVRYRIYDFVGLVSSGEFPHKFDLHGHTVSRGAPKPSTFHGLLLSCRLIYTEAAALLYSASQFILRYNPVDPDPFKPLHALTDKSVACLTGLNIILNQTSCHHHYEYGNYPFCCLEGYKHCGGVARCEWYHKDSHHQLPLLAHRPDIQDDDDDSATETLVAKWHLAASHLSHITSGRLELGLVCDIDPHHERAFEIASLITMPLLSVLPRLRDCHVRLCKTSDARLQQTARDSVMQACRIAPAPYYSKPSTRGRATLSGLPVELRLRILEYTDLIVPNREVTWTRRDQCYATTVRDSFDNEHLSQFFRCQKSRGTKHFVGCFCRRRHGSFSFMCNCWAPPGPTLFLICRTLFRDAQFTFFSRNRFIIHDHKADPCWSIPSLGDYTDVLPEQGEGLAAPYQSPQQHEYPYHRFAASEFLREAVPTRCLAHFRFLEFVFPPYLAQTWPQSGHPAIKDWRATVYWLRDKINAPGLTVRLIGAEVSGASSLAYHKTIPGSDGDTIRKAHMELVRSFKPLVDNGLARFYVHLPYPWQFTAEHRDEQRVWLEARMREIKEGAERLVMGERYEGLYANGRTEPKQSSWTRIDYGMQT